MSKTAKKKAREVHVPPPVERPIKPGEAPFLEPGSKMFKMGPCKIIVSQMPGSGLWHLSISTPWRYPTWDEVVKAWYSLVPGADQREGAMILPKMADYVNIHKYCFQVYELAPEEVQALHSSGEYRVPLAAVTMAQAVATLAGPMAPTALEKRRERAEEEFNITIDEAAEYTEADHQRLVEWHGRKGDHP